METVISTGNTFQQQSTGGYWSWTVTANNIVSVGQLYQVDGIQTPYGRLVDVAVPIPADIVLAMADSITQVQQQLAPLLALVYPTNTTLSVTVTEGDPSIDIGTVPVQNSGAFGSFMTVVATPDVPWLSTSPTSVNGIGKNEQSQFTVRLNPALLLSTSSPYAGHINLQDNRVPPTIIPITVAVTVLPRPVITVDTSIVTLAFSLASMTPSGSQQVTVSNDGPTNSSLSFTAAKLLNNSAWLSFVPSSGGPLGPGGTQIITLSINTSGVPLIPGIYTETLRITSQCFKFPHGCAG